MFLRSSLLATCALALCATPLHAQGVTNFGIQPNFTLTGSIGCNPGEASTFLDVFFSYLRSPNETGPIGWMVSIYDKDTDSPDDLIVVKTGTFNAVGNGGQSLEISRPVFALDSCPVIAGDEDGNSCAEYYVKIDITFTANADPTSVQHVASPVMNLCCDQCVVLAIELSGFGATFNGSTVVVDWSTASETNNAGFQVMRASTPWGPWAPAHQGLIPAQGTPTIGKSYTFIDTDPRARRPWYCLKDIDVNGTAVLHEPVFSGQLSTDLGRFWMSMLPVVL